MLTREYTARIAPPGTFCASCGCAAEGDTVLATYETDALFDHPIVVYRHLSSGGCDYARSRAARRRDGFIEQEANR